MTEGLSGAAPWRLRTDLAWAHGLLWIARTGRGGEPKRDVHLFMADRYGRLADHYSSRGLTEKARRLSLKSKWHYSAAGPDLPPRAVAMALPVPGNPPVDLVSTRDFDGDEIA